MSTGKSNYGINDRRKPVATRSTGHLTIAKSIRCSSNPHHAAMTSFTRRDAPHDYLRIYYFEDGSFLAFEVSYLPVEDGGR